MINKQLDTLLDRWEKSSKQPNLGYFCRDGLITINDQAEQIWNRSERRVVFIQKESLIPDLKDMRAILNPQYNDWFLNRVIGSRVIAWLYGLTHITNEGYPSVADAFSSTIQEETIRTTPFALVNLSKICREKASNNADIYAYAERYKQYLKEELAILNANICVCCGETVFRALKNIVFPHSPFIKVNDWVYYERYTQTIIINSCLPSARKTNEEVYQTLVEKLIEGLRIPTHELSKLDKYITL